MRSPTENGETVIHKTVKNPEMNEEMFISFFLWEFIRLNRGRPEAETQLAVAKYLIQSKFPSYAKLQTQDVVDEMLCDVIRAICPGAAVCDKPTGAQQHREIDESELSSRS
jgi:hypothetical protein